jgi:hypothetical protein
MPAVVRASTPETRSIVAAVCRVSCSRVDEIPAFRARRVEKACDYQAVAHGASQMAPRIGSNATVVVNGTRT